MLGKKVVIEDNEMGAVAGVDSRVSPRPYTELGKIRAKMQRRSLCAVFFLSSTTRRQYTLTVCKKVAAALHGLLAVAV